MEVSIRQSERADVERGRGGLAEVATAACVLAAAGFAFGFLFNRETTLSYSIGYNLYGAERILQGEVPYRDFHTLYPPGTVYLNAALLKVFGVRLYTALFGVFVFKALTTLVLYLGGRQVMPRAWAVAGALYSLVWLRPNGPFKAVPMHYGALLLASAVYCMLRYQRSKRIGYIIAAGLWVGLLVLFKHNIGAYALVGFSVWLLARGGGTSNAVNSERRAAGPSTPRLVLVGALILGCAAPILPVLAYFEARGALGAMMRTLLFGPGEFLASRLAGAPSPVLPVLCLATLCGLGFAIYAVRFGAAGTAAGVFATAAVALFCLAARESWVSGFLFYAPVFVLSAGFVALGFRKKLGEYVWPIGLLVAGAAAAFMETFPRLAREQVVAAMPFVGLFLIYFIFVLWQVSRSRKANEEARGAKRLVAGLALMPLAFLLLGLRFLHHTYFVDGLRLRSDTELGIERGRGVYFPGAAAHEIDEVTRFVEQAVPENGYVFAQSSVGSAFLFLANRKNPSGAQFWGGVGVSADERAATLAALEQRQVRVIITSASDMDAERYGPLRDYIARNFRQTGEFGGVIVLERVS